MIQCPQCFESVSSDHSFCPVCHADLNASRLPTEHGEPVALAIKNVDSSGGSRFLTGMIFADRYRIIGLIGRGGMGEVYRAEDIKLTQTVALKFLPERLNTNAPALARFHREVRIARQVSHPNVCRVFDISEYQGQHFLTMEYVDGEDLASLLRRIGYLPADKAVEITRQICAGLSTAHQIGVLHRDLKPANIMIDGRGKAKIMDFGLAGLAEEFQKGEISAGTPAYMAPEQLVGKEVSTKSDLYSLGLILYELFTAKRAYDAATLQELIKQKEETTPTRPSAIVKEIDPLIERVILRCLESEPSRRPASALQIAAALPGADPLAAALAAGETPSPEMVAAAPKEGVLQPRLAIILLIFAIGLPIIPMLWGRLAYDMIPMKKPPDVLRQRAIEIAERFGYARAPVDQASGFVVDLEFLQHIRQNDSSPARWNQLKSGRPSLVRYWYRQAQHYMVPLSESDINAEDPPVVKTGMVVMSVDTEGRLFFFEAVPEKSPEPQHKDPFHWSVLFQEAGLDITQFAASTPQEIPLQAYDEQMTWTGKYPGAPYPIRIEASAFHGKPVYFEIFGPWRTSPFRFDYEAPMSEKVAWILLLSLFYGALIICAILALKNLRLGRGDRKGAFRVALFLLILKLIGWIFSVHHVPVFIGEAKLLLTGVQSALFWACFVGLMYLALEPILRRRWPHRIISWSRLLSGDFKDPLVGRDILIGAMFGGIGLLLRVLIQNFAGWIGMPPDVPYFLGGRSIGIANLGYGLVMQFSTALYGAFLLTFLLLFLTLLFRRQWLGIAAGCVILSTLAVFGEGVNYFSSVTWIFNVLLAALAAVWVLRFGVLIAVAAIVFHHLWMFFPMTLNFTAWYAADFVVDFILLAAIAIYAFRVSLGGKRIFSNLLPE
jgi:serine/threonine-protein kinase